MFDKQYYCLVAGLREYTLEADTKGFDARAVIDEIVGEVTPGDAKKIRLLQGWYDCENRIHLHHGSALFNPLGNLTREQLEQQAKLPETDDGQEEDEQDDRPFDQAVWEAYYEECARSKSRFLRAWSAFDRDLRLRAAVLTADEPNLLEKEHKLDRIRWAEADELSTFDYFNADTLLAYLVKVDIVARWARLDERTGREMLRRLISDLEGKELINKQ